MGIWNLTRAKAQFSRLIETAVYQGPQTIARRGKNTAVIVQYEYYTVLNEAFQTILARAKADLANQSDHSHSDLLPETVEPADQSDHSHSDLLQRYTTNVAQPNEDW